MEEHFIIIEDDIIINRETKKGQWFDDNGNPYVIYADCINGHKLYSKYKIYNKTQLGHPIYINESFSGNMPLTFGPYTHMPMILKKSICFEIANKYKDWFLFVQSHKIRFSSTNDEKMWGCEECLFGIWSWYIIKTKQGKFYLLNKTKNILIEQRCPNIEFEIKRHNPMFVNLNDSEIKNNKERITYLMNNLTKNYKIDSLYTYKLYHKLKITNI